MNKVAQTQRPVSMSAPGRYTIVINPNARADTFLLDTETGRVWIPTQFPDIAGKPTVWQIQDRVDDKGELATWLKDQTR
jgi:hypothetical protein